MKEAASAPDWKWDDFYTSERDAATVGDKIVGVPALVDNLAIVYNKKLFADAGIAPPSPTWTWDDFRAAAAKLTDSAKGQYGCADSRRRQRGHRLALPTMLWEAGGDILSPDNEHAVFNSEAGVKALTTLQQMAVTDKSLYLDTTNDNGPKLMNSGKIGMLITGPWDLGSLSDIEYDVQIMPTFPGSAGAHQTISGPDNWVVFNNGDKRKQAATDFVEWLTAADQVKSFSLATGDLPTRVSVGQDQSVRRPAEREAAWRSGFRGEPGEREEGQADRRAVSGHLGGAGSGDRVRLARQRTALSGAQRRSPDSGRKVGREIGQLENRSMSGNDVSTRPPRVGGSDSLTGWALVSPAVVLIGVFGLLPVLMSLALSFQKSDLLSPETPWVGVENYRKLADDPVFAEAIKNTIVFTALFVPGTMLVGPARCRGDEPVAAVHLRLPDGRVRDDGGLDDLRGHHLPVAYGPRLRFGQRRSQCVRDAVAGVPRLAVTSAVRHRRDDDLGLDRLFGHRVSCCAAGCSG